MVTAGLLLLLPLGIMQLGPAWAADDEEPPSSGTSTAADTDGDQGSGTGESTEDSGSQDDQSAESSGENADKDSSGGEDAEDQPLPEGVRRRMRSAEQERRYKQRKTREDPFLNPPVGPGASASDGFYNPADWLRTEVYCGVSRYMVQDDTGEVVGHLILGLERESDPVLGDFIKLEQVNDLDNGSRTQLWIYAETLKPRLKEAVVQLPEAAGSAQAQDGATTKDGAEAADSIAIQPLYEDAQRLDVEYLFDRMTIEHNVGGITARRQMRQLPFSYDIDQLPLLMRQLEVKHEEWPFEAVLCDPSKETHLPVSIAQPTRVENVMMADGQVADCYEFAVHVGDEQRTYLVQRIPPHKLVKYTIGPLTYTLTDYVER